MTLEHKNLTPMFQFGQQLIDVESIYPKISFTRSKTGQTSTVTLFFSAKMMSESPVSLVPISKISKACFLWKKQSIETKDIQIHFRNGNPFFYECNFFFFSNDEYSNFLQMLLEFPFRKQLT